MKNVYKNFIFKYLTTFRMAAEVLTERISVMSQSDIIMQKKSCNRQQVMVLTSSFTLTVPKSIGVFITL